ncbi:hypothetical protein F2Q70_00007820 [Brassica cretica]|uniref:RNase H type-1 domain-containing protein n=1 Tax=Brassica cretica TaxID=69181 RepID=A0A8S9M5Z7_BRACR|nr:hypothetical protein F2Q70_00007820 [Brassica cretica]KAF3549723.1 hypothetical protein DY000_02001099 [Brassica cretica]
MTAMTATTMSFLKISMDTELESSKVNAADENKVSSSLKKIGDGLGPALDHARPPNLYTSVCCESDSTQLIQAVNSGSTATEIYGITADIISLAGLFETIFFRWISRVKNSEADGLAKQCLADEIAFNCIT